MPALLTKIFGRPKMTYRGAASQRPISECCTRHDLMPRWRGPQVMEDDSQAMGFVCHECGREFLPGDVRGRRLIRGGAALPEPTPMAAALAGAVEDGDHDGTTEVPENTEPTGEADTAEEEES